VLKEVEQEEKLFLNHVMHLVVHGALHLLGYDHEADSEAEIMESLERDVLSNFGVADPYQ
jgi:probable rRNA maturation factor